MNVMRTRRSQSSSNLVQNSPSTSLDAARDKLLGVKHQSVLLHEAIEMLDIQPNDTVVDATLGRAGHAREIIKKLGRGGLFIGFDLDSDAISRAEARLTDTLAKKVLINTNFADLHRELSKRDIHAIDKALFDLGWSSDQLDAGRGFSFQKDEPLIMTYRTDPALITARVVVNEWEESSIADIIFGWGEERYARRIARAIVHYRAAKTIETARELAEIVKKAVPGSYARGRIHPATRTFQALRIAVNDEMGALQKGIRSAWELLKADGRIAVISFHSIEDRAVKQLFAEFEKRGEGMRLTKKPLVPTDSEIQANPRSRSAKLLVIQKNHDHRNQKNKQISTARAAGDAAA